MVIVRMETVFAISDFMERIVNIKNVLRSVFTGDVL